MIVGQQGYGQQLGDWAKLHFENDKIWAAVLLAKNIF